MTVYDLIQMLTFYQPDVELQFDIGDLSSYDCRCEFKPFFYEGSLHGELHIVLE